MPAAFLRLSRSTSSYLPSSTPLTDCSLPPARASTPRRRRSRAQHAACDDGDADEEGVRIVVAEAVLGRAPARIVTPIVTGVAIRIDSHSRGKYRRF